MGYDWEQFGRRGLDVASAMTSLAFSTVKDGTKLGFSVARDVASNTIGVTAATFDRVVFGGHVTAPVLEGAVSSAITFAERLTLAPIYFGEYISTASLRAAHSSIDILSVIFPGSSEASFSLVSFITLVKREWDSPEFSANMPAKRYGLTEVVRALIAWVALQGVTQEWQEKIWFNYLQEIQVYDHTSGPQLKRTPSRIRVTSDVIFPGNRGQLIAADIGEARTTRQRSSSTLSIGKLSISSMSSFKWKDTRIEPPTRSIAEVKANLRRFSKMVLAGYGGASLLFFGIDPLFTSRTVKAPTHSNEKDAEEAQLESAVNAAEAEASGNQTSPVYLENDSSEYSRSWWDILMGKHDKEIFESSVHHGDLDQSNAETRLRATAVIGIERQMPRFWVLTDHDRRQVVLILRGTMSLNELAVDLTCEPAEFQPASSKSHEERDDHLFYAGRHTPGTKSKRQSCSSTSPIYHVHGGMLRMARVMGEIGKPVHLAVMDALIRNPEYELILSGHSLGAGVATLLALMWADPTTCLTVNSSGLPVDRPVAVYCVAPPCLVDAELSRLAAKLVVSFVYSNDIVSRISLGSIRDMRNASLWLCDANEKSGGKEGYVSVTQRARQWKSGHGSPNDPEWFLSVRKTLEVNMQMADLFPPGRVLWAMRDVDLHSSHRLSSSPKDHDKLRLFEVLDVKKVFSQVVFSRNMLGAHMPHRYDSILHELL
ncbi:hypothetical protein BJ138DRAFT_1148322 [Hygrophoropsis aurantiaca]|uniref:Uncharacterized protein n=1 Tax=Hygrophoropsis aurantiaca TaxID=72124 RepID=A0ACB8AGG4_9AGAM|nr:hypothetical protein BJ138DRAFT_1148322 [Hygrophoropsis aurantiaca]